MCLNREMMISAHHNRIEQLRESFKKKMEEADAWPGKVSKLTTGLLDKLYSVCVCLSYEPLGKYLNFVKLRIFTSG